MSVRIIWAIPSGSPSVRTRNRPATPPDWASGRNSCGSVSRSRPYCRTSPDTPTTVAQVWPLSSDTCDPIGLPRFQYFVIARLTITTAGLSTLSTVEKSRPSSGMSRIAK